jgi:FKBP-type peptidyl-prolyl cis-trans isomerase
MNKRYILTRMFCIGLLVGSVYTYVRTKMPDKKNQEITHASGLKSLILKEAPANAPAVKPGQKVRVHYTGWLFNPSKPESKGTKFDSSVDRGQPFEFTLGAGMVIRGWDEGVALMKVGEERRLIIPANLAYGSRSVGNVIPANATLVFDVKVL